ncbi:MAG: DUF58 domain-containing protein [Planctomycetota bacterium]|nr:MAG: DUF58 domain-containing protein [Planctomycetota bacterium]
MQGEAANAGAAPGALDPAVLDRLHGLELVARAAVEGFQAGVHRSARRGSSAEFALHREYVPGDELRRLDWKVAARLDRLVVKEFEEESNLDCHIVLDQSASMKFGSLRWSKLDYARWCAAALATLVLGNRDRCGLVLCADSVVAKVPPASGAAQRAAILGELERARPAGPTQLGTVLDWLSTRLRRRGLVVVLSDFLDEPARIADGIRKLASLGHEPILAQVLDPAELSFDYEGLLQLEDLEGDARVRIDARALRNAYLAELEAHQRALRAAAHSLGLDLLEIRTDAPLDAVLSTYLARRMARTRGRR